MYKYLSLNRNKLSSQISSCLFIPKEAQEHVWRCFLHQIQGHQEPWTGCGLRKILRKEHMCCPRTKKRAVHGCMTMRNERWETDGCEVTRRCLVQSNVQKIRYQGQWRLDQVKEVIIDSIAQSTSQSTHPI